MNTLINRSLSKTLAVLAVAASLMGAANIARASVINVTVDSSGNLLHTIGIANKDEYVAANGGSNSNNVGDNYNFLVTEVGRYNATHNPDLVTPIAPVTVPLNYVDQGLLTGTTYTSLAGWDYIVLHWGAGNAGDQGWWQALYLGGAVVSFTIVPEVNELSVGGFSSARYFNQDVGINLTGGPVPDSGSVVIPMGLAFLALGLVARKKKVG